jgi:hypothetical protein
MVKNIINQALDEYSQQVYGPEGIAYNSPSKLQYDIDANAAAARVPSAVAEKAFPGAIGQGLGFLSDLAMPALALGSSPFYDTYQAIGRAKQANPVDTGPYAGIVDDMEVPAGPTMGQLVNAIGNENIIDSAIGRTLGAGQNLANRFSNIGTAQAAEVDPFAAERGRLVEAGIDPMSVGLVGGTGDPNRPTMADIAGLGDLGNPTGDPRVVSEEMGMVGRPTTSRPTMADIAGEINENLIDRGNPLGDSRIASEEQGLVGGIPDRNRGMPGAPTGAYEMIGGTPVAVGDVLGMQQALEKADFYEEPSKRGIDLGLLGMLAGPAGFLTGSNALRGIGLAANIASGRAGRAVDAVSRGLGSLGTKISGKMRGINPITGKPNTQAQYEANRTARQQQNRTNRMIDRIAAGKKTRSNPRDAGTTKAQKDAISAAIRDSYRGGGGGGSSGGGKIVCTMMNERYGFGSFRNKIWMKFHENHGPEYQKGYHAIFLPLVKIAKGEGKINTAVRKVLEHMGRHVTADMFKIMKGKKRDTLGRIYRAIFEPTCRIIGKIKSALGRG